MKKEVKTLTKGATGMLKKISPTQLLIGGIGVFALAFGVRTFVGLFKTDEEKRKEKELDNAIDYELKNGSQLTYSLAQYSIYADLIEEATDTTGTDEQAVFGVFMQMQNNADVLQLIKSYGIRFNLSLFSMGNYTLSQLLIAEGIQSDIQQILAGKGITVII